MEARPSFRSLRGVAALAALLLSSAVPLPLRAAHGGPDGYGYTWKDSAEGVPVEDIPFDASPSLACPAASEWLSPPGQPIGFDFFFYGRWYRTLQVSDNGWASFVTQAGSCPSGTWMPAGAEPEAFVAPLWDDLSISTVQWGPILGGEGFEIAWEGFQPDVVGFRNVSFRLYLFRDGRIRFT